MYCVTLLRGLDPAEVLRRFGARTSTQMSFVELDLAVSDFAMVTGGGDGGGYVGAVSVLRHDTPATTSTTPSTAS
ncbi:DUF6461 domain-containing protein [Nonomuraea sp. NPDC004186]